MPEKSSWPAAANRSYDGIVVIGSFPKIPWVEGWKLLQSLSRILAWPHVLVDVKVSASLALPSVIGTRRVSSLKTRLPHRSQSKDLGGRPENQKTLEYANEYVPPWRYPNLLEHSRRHGSAPDGGLRGAVEVPGLLALLLLVDEVAARSVGAVAVDPVLLTVLGLVLVVSHNILLKLKEF